ncbi:MAG: methylisocitrate lyase [Chlorobi bacterium]|nr:methylisocitrate lyase [Chlorobiota bacterium]
MKEYIKNGEHLVVPGVFNPLTGIMARRKGFKAIYISGAAFSASLGLPDLGLFTLTELVDFTASVVKTSGLPAIVDADTGFGEALNVVRTVRELEWAGAAAIQLEDQVLPKKCGHLSGKRLVPTHEMVQKIKAAKSVARHTLIIARTDARGVYGMKEALDRAKAYVEAGADIIFPEALTSEEEFAGFSKELHGVPLLANMTEFGKTPYIPAHRFFELGYQIVIFPVTTLRMALKSVQTALTTIKEKGTQQSILDQMLTRKELYELIDYYDYESFDQKLTQETSKLESHEQHNRSN